MFLSFPTPNLSLIFLDTVAARSKSAVPIANFQSSNALTAILSRKFGQTPPPPHSGPTGEEEHRALEVALTMQCPVEWRRSGLWRANRYWGFSRWSSLAYTNGRAPASSLACARAHTQTHTSVSPGRPLEGGTLGSTSCYHMGPALWGSLCFSLLKLFNDNDQKESTLVGFKLHLKGRKM